jgi:penicillin-binding protein 2
MYYLQVLKSDEYKTLSENNCIRLFIVPASRGLITDRHGQVLALNHNYYRIMYDKQQENLPPETIASKLASTLNLTPEGEKLLIKKINQAKYNTRILLHNELSWEQLVEIEVSSFDLPGIDVDIGQVRYYPYGAFCSHVIGYTGQPTEKELAGSNHFSPDIKIGKIGIEKEFNNKLSGIVGTKKMEVDAHGYTVRELSSKASIAGEELTLTINIALQEYVSKRLANKAAASVVMDVSNGHILALCSTPSFDPNKFAHGITSSYWQELINDHTLPLVNKAIAMQYPPGSIFKLMVALAALEDGIPENTNIYCPGYATIGNRKFHCWKEGGHGEVNGIVQAITQSCNTYFFTLGKKLGIEKFTQMAKKFGFGEKTLIEIPGEVSGIIPDKNWKRNKFKKSWHVGDTFNSAIGQGFVQATPIQLALLGARIATLGKMVTPTLISTADNQVRNFPDLDVSKKHIKTIQLAMDNVVNLPIGSAYNSRITNDLMRMAGKTGTSQVISKRGSEDLSKEYTSYENRNHGLFVGYAPAHAPKYVCATVIEHGGSGSGAAAPVVKDILTEIQNIRKKNG